MKKLTYLAFIAILLFSCKKEDELVHSLSLDKTELTVDVDQTFTLIADYQPNSKNLSYEWSSSDPSIAAVDTGGRVRGVSAGKATITVKVNELTAACEITVSPLAIKALKLNKSGSLLDIGMKDTLKALIEPVNASDKKIRWTVLNADVATVDSTGLVVAVGAGSTEVIATSGNGKAEARCRITVNEMKVTGINLQKTELSMERGASEKLLASVKPANASNPTVIWTSSEPEIARVSPKGEVRGLQNGTAVITARTEDGDFSVSCKVTVIPVAVQSVIIDKASLEMLIYSQQELKAQVFPASADNKNVRWESSNESIARVSAEGKVEAIKPGSCLIYAISEDGGKKTNCKVKVLDITDYMSLQIGDSKFSSLNGFIFGDIYSRIANKSTESVQLTSFTITDSYTNKIAMHTDKPADLGQLAASASHTMGMKMNAIYLPRFKWTFIWKGKEYTMEHQYTESGVKGALMNIQAPAAKRR